MRSNVLNQTRMVLATHASGHLIGVALQVRYEDEAMGKLIAVMHTVSSPYESCMIVNPKTMEITSASLNFSSVFGFNRRDVLTGRIKLFQLIPEFRDDDSVHSINEEVYKQMVCSEKSDRDQSSDFVLLY